MLILKELYRYQKPEVANLHFRFQLETIKSLKDKEYKADEYNAEITENKEQLTRGRWG